MTAADNNINHSNNSTNLNKFKRSTRTNTRTRGPATTGRKHTISVVCVVYIHITLRNVFKSLVKHEIFSCPVFKSRFILISAACFSVKLSIALQRFCRWKMTQKSEEGKQLQKHFLNRSAHCIFLSGGCGKEDMRNE